MNDTRINTDPLAHTKGSALTAIFDELLHEQKKKLIGKFLTLIDSTIADSKQNKAAKDILNQLVYEQGYGGLNSPNKWISEELLSPKDSNRSNIFGSKVIFDLITAFKEA